MSDDDYVETRWRSHEGSGNNYMVIRHVLNGVADCVHEQKRNTFGHTFRISLSLLINNRVGWRICK